MMINQKIQKAYGPLVGHTKFNKRSAFAGSKINGRLVITVGKFGMDESGMIKILFRIVTDAGMWQFDDPNKPNFVSINSSNHDVSIIPTSSGLFPGFQSKMHVRPWNKGCSFLITKSFLKQNDKIVFNIKAWDVQTFIQKNFQIKILLDPFASGNFIEINPVKLKIRPDKPSVLKIVAPTDAVKKSVVKATIRTYDKWGNPCLNPQKTTFPVNKAVNCFETRANGLRGLSNPTLAINQNLKHFWADLHAQSEETAGTGSIDEFFSFARDKACLDVVCHQANDFQISDQFWIKINKTCQKFNTEGSFITFPGYEWSANTANGGDRNIIFPDPGKPIFRSSHALVSGNTESDAINFPQLMEKLNNHDCLIIAHAGGRYSNLNWHDSQKEKLVEIHSMWGTFEWLFLDALRKGYKIGVTANSDDHFGRVGSAGPGRSEFVCQGGLTCILSEKLTRKHIFEALMSRHTYATTGPRIFLSVTLADRGKIKAIMGDLVKIKTLINPLLRIHVVGLTGIDKLEVWSGNRLIHSWAPSLGIKNNALQILWTGAKSFGRDRKINWIGDIQTNFNLRLNKNILPINFLNFNHRLDLTTKQKLVFNGATTGNTQGIKIRPPVDGQIKININREKINIHSADFKEKVISFGGIGAKLTISPVAWLNSHKEISLDVPIPTGNKHQLFVKLIQADGNVAWSSPIFIE